jgi:cytochrome d ubiquinol oxidase subunit I
MVGVGMLMLLVSWFAAYWLWRRRDLSRPLAMILVAMTFSGWVATLAGWYVTEIGRQPWLVTGVLTTAQAASEVSAGMIGSTLAMYLVVYAALIIAYMSALVHLAAKARHGVKPLDRAAIPAHAARAHSVGALAKGA